MNAPQAVETVVIGAGHAGLAVSRLLAAAGRQHVVIERGRIGERWRSARWDSLRLLTPAWLTRLPGWSATGDPDAFLSAASFVQQLEQYSASFHPPVVAGTTVERLVCGPDGAYDVRTDQGTWRARSVVVATGAHGRPRFPSGIARADVQVLTSDRYRNPERCRGGRCSVGRRVGIGGADR